MSATLLDRALVLAQHELEAIRAGDVESAEQHFGERSLLMEQAAETPDEQKAEDYRHKLIALEGYNQILQEEGQELLEKIRQQLQGSRKTLYRNRCYVRTSLLQ